MCLWCNVTGRLDGIVEAHKFFKETPSSISQAHPAQSKAPISSVCTWLMSFGFLFWFICQGALDESGIFNSNALGYSDLPWGTILSHYGSNSSASQQNMLLLGPIFSILLADPSQFLRSDPNWFLSEVCARKTGSFHQPQVGLVMALSTDFLQPQSDSDRLA